MNTPINIFTIEDILPLWQSTVGIERETLRIYPDGQQAKSPHPPQLGNRSFHPYIQTDFAESQLEFITPPEQSSDKLIDWLSAFHQIAAHEIDDNHEWLWPMSIPAIIPSAQDVKVAQLDSMKELGYREHLIKIYGYQVQLLSGIHYNFQINPEVMASKVAQEMNPIKARNEIYTTLARNYLRYRWLLTYLFGSTPFIDDKYETKLYGKPDSQPMRSIRQSHYGYKNSPNVTIRYDSFEHFVEDLEAAVESQELSMEKELYADVRFRKNHPVRKLLDDGIQYLEFRNFDINPFSPVGMTVDDLDFVKIFILSLLLLDDVETNEEIAKGDAYNEAISQAHPLDKAPYTQEAHMLFDVMTQVASQLDSVYDQDYVALVTSKAHQLDHPEETVCGRLLQEAHDFDSLLNLGLKFAETYQAEYLTKDYQLHGFTDLEISTQDVLKEAIKAGIKVDMVDSSDNLFKLSDAYRTEYVRKANMTQYDSLISYYLMENKVATKDILAQAQLATPSGKSFDHIEEAKAYFDQIKGSSFVVKPKSTNYGLAISIFTDDISKDVYESALEEAFQEDSTVIIEDFVAGEEFRFYVQADQVIAVTQRLGAHVVGDGQHTIQELIAIENQHPLRGPQHQAPLTNLQTGESERIQLAAQNLNFDDIPEKGQTVYLRSNSNVSTGGLPIDQTETVHDSYKDLVIQAAQALGAVLCGVDIIIEDPQAPAQEGNHSIIEANFNPAMMIHRFPGKGQPRYLGRALLEMMFPETTAHKERPQV